MDLAEAWFGAFRDRNIAGAPLANDFTHLSPFGVVEGRAAYVDLIAANEDAFYNATIEIVDVVERPGAAAVRYLVEGSPATDWIYERDGEIVSVYSYYHVGPPPTL